MNLSGMKLVSRAKGEYAGRCPFTGLGHDRFHVWPECGRWWCRKGDCIDCPGLPAKSGWGRWGYIDPDALKSLPPASASPVEREIPLQKAIDFAANLDEEALEYLASRGIRPDTARRFLLGRQGSRLTIPNILTTKRGRRCAGIKKRWLGTPPEDWIDRYVMEPGSDGRTLFNWNRLVQKAHEYLLIVEGVLDTILLDQLGVPAVAPFGGGGLWYPEWTKWFSRVKRIVIVADNDGDGKGWAYAERKREMLGRGLITFPPGGAKDVGEAHLAGENLARWALAVSKS